MPQTLTHLLTHVIFSTKDRRAMIDADLKPRLHAYLGGIVREIGGHALAINGMADHVHLLLSLPPKISIAEAVRLMKTNSSKWAHEQAKRRLFSWQAGYSAFSVSQSAAPRVIRYIQEQERHHRRTPFQEELVRFLKVHGVAYDERYVWQ